ncbi:MAG: Rieske (2Fe-2S) protein [Gammaproteobacteria bacterium]|nr:MAG: Rieske (2Fe-2S) protein [Gammaproteobacteria bacterium]
MLGGNPMYINFWYPIAKSEDVVTYEPHRARVLGQQLVAFRDSDGAAHVLSDVCIHRGAALGQGLGQRQRRRVSVPRLAVRRRRQMHAHSDPGRRQSAGPRQG